MSDKKVAIVTGASRGIGRDVAIRLASMGYDVALLARNREKLEQLAEELSQQYGVQASVHPLDVSEQEAVKSAVESIVDQHGRVDVLFNNAGIAHKGTSDLDPERFKAMLEVNLLGAYYMIYAVSGVMKKQRSGYIFNLVSRSGMIGREQLGGYAASKFALRGYSEALYRELSEYDIKVTSLHPGWVATDMTKGLAVPASEMIQTGDIADLVECLLGLSRYTFIRDIMLEPKAVVKSLFPFQVQQAS